MLDGILINQTLTSRGQYVILSVRPDRRHLRQRQAEPRCQPEETGLMTTAQLNQKEVDAVKQIIGVIRDTIKDLGRVPSGHLYATLQGQMSLTSYQYIISILQASGCVEVKNHEIIWIGGQK